MTTTGGQPVNAVYGFASMLFKVLDDEKPDAVIVAFDGPRADLIRSTEYAEYKAHRPTMPDELRGQMDLISHLLGHMNIPVVTAVGHEADDVIGTIACRVSAGGGEAVIVTGDRDTLQLVRPGVRVMMTGKGITETVSFDEDAVIRKYGVTPAQLPDMAGLKGDASDNIPGVPGIGEKGAAALIQQYGSLESLYEHMDEMKGKRKAALEENRDLAFLSRKLSVLEKDVPVDLDIDSVSFADWDKHEVLDYLSALEFKTLARRFIEMFGDQLPASDAAVHGGHFEYRLVDAADDDAVASFVQQAEALGAVGLAAMTSGSSFCDIRLEGFALATSDSVLLAVEGRALEAGRMLAESDTIEKWTHEAKSALEAMDRAGFKPSRFTFDTAIAAYLENPSLGSYIMRDIWERNLGGDIVVDGLEPEPARKEQPSLLDDIQEKGHGERQIAAAGDAARIYHLKPVLAEKLETVEMLRLERDVELPFMLVLKDMEETGVALDASVLHALSDEAAGTIAGLERDIYGLAGHEFKISSTRQLADVLFEELKLPASKKTKTGFSTDVSVLEALRDRHEIAAKIIEYREATKLKSTYFDVLPSLVCPRTGRLHCLFNQTATSTGRISSSNPNLQNIPVRTEVGRKIRSAFIPSVPSWKLVVADYSQIELRVLAHESRDALLLAAFENDRDIHTETASLVFGVPAAEVSAEMRRMAKVVNFGIVYGMGYYGLSTRLGISMEEATAYIDTYFETYEGVRRYRDRCISEARDRGYAVTILGRRRFIPELMSENRQTRELGERLAINTPLQGSAADIIKKAMVDAHAALIEAGLEARMTVQIHDEIIVESPPDEVEEASAVLTSKMSGAVPLVVPLKVESGVYDNWGEAKQ